MRVLFCKWNTYGQNAVQCAFEKLDYEVDLLKLDLSDGIVSKEKRDVVGSILYEQLKSKKYDFVFSINYFSTISDICQYYDTRYVSWCNDAPCLELFDESVYNPVNRIFSFDSSVVELLNSLNVKNCHHLHLYYDHYQFDKSFDYNALKSQVAFVGTTYENRGTYKTVIDAIPDALAKRIEGAIKHASRHSSSSALDKCLKDNVIEELNKYISLHYNERYIGSEGLLYRCHFLGMEASRRERLDALYGIANKHPIDFYTRDDFESVTNITNRGAVKYDTEMPEVFRNAKINLNMTMKNIKTGIPLRIFDVIGCGGFLISNKQKDMEGVFENKKDIVLYDSLDELFELVDWYLAHDDERIAIQRNGTKKVREEHNVDVRVKELMGVIE